jgi:hypothetical protein
MEQDNRYVLCVRVGDDPCIKCDKFDTCWTRCHEAVSFSAELKQFKQAICCFCDRREACRSEEQGSAPYTDVVLAGMEEAAKAAMEKEQRVASLF